MRITVIVHTRAKHPKVMKTAEGVLHIYVATPPIDGKANEAVAKALAREYSVPVSHITLVHGHKAKQKVFDVV